VEEVGRGDDSVWKWSLRWRRDRFEWEIPMELELGMQISRAIVSKDVKDVQVWSCEESGCFIVSSTYDYLDKLDRGPQYDAFKYLWKAKAFPNVLITAWRALLGRLPTRESLDRKGDGNQPATYIHIMMMKKKHWI